MDTDLPLTRYQSIDVTCCLWSELWGQGHGKVGL